MLISYSGAILGEGVSAEGCASRGVPPSRCRCPTVQLCFIALWVASQSGWAKPAHLLCWAILVASQHGHAGLTRPSKNLWVGEDAGEWAVYPPPHRPTQHPLASSVTPLLIFEGSILCLYTGESSCSQRFCLWSPHRLKKSTGVLPPPQKKNPNQSTALAISEGLSKALQTSERLLKHKKRTHNFFNPGHVMPYKAL